jgi:sulfate permease, SulP family
MTITPRIKHQAGDKLLLLQLRQALHPNQLLPGLAIGLTTGILGVLFDLSFAALIFSGSLSNHLAAGVDVVLFSAAATRIMVALMSSFPGMVADLGTVPTAMLAWSAGMVAKSLPITASPTEILVTVITMIALTSLLTGAFLLMLGMLRMGEVMRSLPYPVVGGFVASTGWLLVKGAFNVMTDHPLGITQLPALIQPNALIQWLPGLLLAGYLMTLSHHRVHPFVMSASLVAVVGLFYILLLLSGTSAAQAGAQGLTLNIPAIHNARQFSSLSNLMQVNWAAIADQWMCSATVALTTAISLLMNIGGIELVANREIDSNRELKVAGIANLLVGLAGGILSFHSLSKSVLAYKMGSRTRLATLVGAVVFVGVPLLGSPLLTHFPKPVLGGLLLFLGLSLMGEWVYTAWFKLPKADFWIVQLIWVVSSIVGFLQGLILGWLVAVVLFMHQYSRLYAIKSGIWGTERRSSAERPTHEQKILQQQGHQLHVMELQGLLFFGTINGLVSKIRKRIANPMPVRFIILDFHGVPDIDSFASNKWHSIMGSPWCLPTCQTPFCKSWIREAV